MEKEDWIEIELKLFFILELVIVFFLLFFAFFFLCGVPTNGGWVGGFF